ncbi:MAG TPA: hypothetical protein VJN18_00740 [Polyangiaceae bacterium]|nr:hypothetical protein [Polyangiaceae bacterium]
MPALSADRRKLQRELAEHLRQKDREALAALRTKIDAAKTERRQMVRAAREACRTALLTVRERQAAERRRLTLEHQAEREHGRVACVTGKAEAKERGHGLENAAKSHLREERVFQRQIRQAGRKPPERSSARERGQEDDDAVRNNLPPELIPVFDRHRRSFKGSPRRSRTEQFLEWAEENPGEVLAVQQGEADRAFKELLRQERDYARSLRRKAHRAERPSELKSLLADVPF